ncbi:MAG: MATE family efflux transporter [Reichenbachiella sp.]
MTTKEHLSKNWTLAYPVMLSQVGHMMVGVADSIMVGQLGTVPLAAVSLGNSVFSVVMLFGIGVSYGMTPLIARADGGNDKKMSASVLKHGLLLNGLLGVLLLGLCIGLSYVFPYLDQDAEVLNGALPYFLVLSASVVPLMFFQTGRQFAEGLSMTRQAMFISISGNILNVILNYILIFGKFGVEPQGLIGAGYATLTMRLFMPVVMGFYILYSTRLKKYRAVFKGVQWDKTIFLRILKIGAPSGFQYVFEVGAFGAAAIMIGWFGAVPLAAHQIALNLSAITYMAATGLAAAGSIRMGNQLGRKDYKTLKEAGWTLFGMVFLMMIVFGFVFVIFRATLPLLYIDEPEVIQLASWLMVIAALFQVSDGLQSVGLGVLRGLSDVKVPTIVTFISYWVVAIPGGYLLGVYMDLGAIGVWIGLSVGLTLAALSHMSRFYQITARFPT